MDTWDYAIGQDFVRIERVRGDEVLGLVVELPLGCSYQAEIICNEHNKENDNG